MWVAWRIPGIPEVDWLHWLQTITAAATKQKEVVVSYPWSEFNVQRELDKVNTTPGRRIIWTTPHFIPNLAMEQELDSLRQDGILLAGVQTYQASFNPGQDRPETWKQLNLLSPAAVVFQFAGQSKVLPRMTFDTLRQWAATKARQHMCYILSAKYIGARATGPIMRSRIGDIYADCWNGQAGALGSLLTGGTALFRKAQLRDYWTQEVEYLRRAL